MHVTRTHGVETHSSGSQSERARRGGCLRTGAGWDDLCAVATPAGTLPRETHRAPGALGRAGAGPHFPGAARCHRPLVPRFLRRIPAPGPRHRAGVARSPVVGRQARRDPLRQRHRTRPNGVGVHVCRRTVRSHCALVLARLRGTHHASLHLGPVGTLPGVCGRWRSFRTSARRSPRCAHRTGDAYAAHVPAGHAVRKNSPARRPRPRSTMRMSASRRTPSPKSCSPPAPQAGRRASSPPSACSAPTSKCCAS